MAELTTSGTAVEAAGKKSLSKIKIAAIICVIVLLQCVLAYLYLPGGDSSAKGEAKKEAAATHPFDKPEKEVAGDGHSDAREVDLGKSASRPSTPIRTTTLLIDSIFSHCRRRSRRERRQRRRRTRGSRRPRGKAGEGAEDDNTNFGKLFKRIGIAFAIR